MKRWFCSAVGRHEYVAADTEDGARQRCAERHGFTPETLYPVAWPHHYPEPQVVELHPHHYGISLRASR